MAVSLSKRVQKVKPSPTLAVTARAARLKAEGHDIIGLGAGEPDFDTPVHIADAGVEAIRTASPDTPRSMARRNSRTPSSRSSSATTS